MKTYEIVANVDMYIEANSLEEAKAIADEELSWSNNIEHITIIQTFELDDGYED